MFNGVGGTSVDTTTRASDEADRLRQKANLFVLVDAEID